MNPIVILVCGNNLYHHSLMSIGNLMKSVKHCSRLIWLIYKIKFGNLFLADFPFNLDQNKIK